MIKRIRFKNYKAFSGDEVLEVKPITLIIGKNSSGKSSILKLFPMLSKILNNENREPLYLNNYGISMGAEYSDLFYKRQITGLELGVEMDNNVSIQSEYFVNERKVGIASIQTTRGPIAIKRDLLDDKSNVYGMLDRQALQDLQIDPQNLKLKVHYIGPFRVQAPHSIVFQGFDDDLNVGYKGEGSYALLLNSYRSDKVLYNRVSDWMDQNLEKQRLRFSNASDNNGIFTLMVEREGFSINATGVGQGLAQVLPIIVQSYLAEKGSVNLLEQPALHLHPAAHANVAKRLGLSAKENQCTYIIESHSENILLGFRHLVADRSCEFSKDDIAIYYVDQDENGSFLKLITLNENGDFSDWPTGVFSESFEILRQINRMRI